MTIARRTILPLFMLFSTLFVWAADAEPEGQVAPKNSESVEGSGLQRTPAYVLGPDDQIVIRALELNEISDKPFLVETSGFISLPLLGRIRASGLTIEQLEEEIAGRAREYVKDPQVSVSITEFRSQPVSVLGAVANPGSHQLRGRKSLYEVISLAGGLRADAGHRIKITRRLENGRIPLPDALDDPSGQFSIGEVLVADIMTASNPAANIPIMPNDVISVPRANLVYVIGEVGRTGGFVLAERSSVSILEALSMAGGLGGAAAPKRARILRQVDGAVERKEIHVDLQAILRGKKPDIHLEADDILFVPSSTTKKLGAAALTTLVTTGTNMIIWGSVFR